MPIANVEDNRKNNKNVNIQAIFEPSYHDSDVEGATEFPIEEDSFVYHEINNTTIAAAIEWAAQWSYPVTLYIYDVGTN